MAIHGSVLFMKRVAIYFRHQGLRSEPDGGTHPDLRRAVEEGGAVVVATYCDDGGMAGRGKYTGWNELVRTLGQIDQVLVATAGDLPGRTVADLLKILATFHGDHVDLRLHKQGIDTSTGFGVLEIIEVYRRAKLSAAIRRGQAAGRVAGRITGRPAIPPSIRNRIRSLLAEGNAGTRAIARRFGVSPASVINIRKTLIEVGGDAA
jgi:DNA invertase Pin-like site-specific DNA recombinase